MPKIIYYYQTFNDLNKILYPNTPITHIHLSAIHFGNKDQTPYIHLNNYDPNDYKFDSVWKQLEEAEKYNITTILMVGGEGGAFQNLFTYYNIYYPMLKKLILDKKVIKGIDLDVEEYVNLNDIKALIRNLKKDFGEDFIISMAPVQSSLQNNYPGMGGFIYKNLYDSPEGKMIDYFNGQFYSEYTKDSYDEAIKNGFPAEKIVMGMISGENYKNELKNVFLEYKEKFGGVFIWEYYNAPDNWYLDVKTIMS